MDANITASKDLLAKLARNSEVGELLDAMVAQQAANDASDAYDEAAARALEAAMGHLRNALEVAARFSSYSK